MAGNIITGRKSRSGGHGYIERCAPRPLMLMLSLHSTCGSKIITNGFKLFRVSASDGRATPGGSNPSLNVPIINNRDETRARVDSNGEHLGYIEHVYIVVTRYQEAGFDEIRPTIFFPHNYILMHPLTHELKISPSSRLYYRSLTVTSSLCNAENDDFIIPNQHILYLLATS